MLSRSAALRLVVGLAWISCGCATDTVNNSMRQMIGVITGQPVDDTRTTKDEEDGWDDVGKQARAEQAPMKDSDPMRNLFVSPQAQEIERSLGVQ
jgi:hypothetical protein